jgi:hypothetical protein
LWKPLIWVSSTFQVVRLQAEHVGVLAKVRGLLRLGAGDGYVEPAPVVWD